MKRLATLMLLTFWSMSVAGDMFTPSSSCSRPFKSYAMSDWERDQFMSQVERYKQCIEDFVDEQNDAVRKHQAAADEAIEEWNSFVRLL